MNDKERTVGFRANIIDRDETPYDKHIKSREPLRIEAGGQKATGIVTQVESYRGADVIVLNPYILFGPNNPKIIYDKTQEIITNGALTLITPIGMTLEDYVEEIIAKIKKDEENQDKRKD